MGRRPGFLAPGVEVGAGSLVSAGSVLLENAPPKSLMRGNPAVVVKKFEETKGA